ncbi:asparagine synthetase B [Sphingomonas aurantiaca]|uniref:asparagine synthetase B family protein n=1 Tax=Sphingomonas aurantiaca TaxID=185949 RepID=UPI002FE085C8
MCGIAGAWGKDPTDPSGEALRPMASAISYRGPDDGGVWTDAEHGITLLHRRLAIVDLSPAGHQPMTSTSGALVIVYNGEIYNHDDLRGKLATQGLAPEWRGHSDTETLLACIEAWGVERTVSEAVGMFAFGLWNRTTGTLTLARDRFGEKPLYYGWQGGRFLFGSELKALAAHPAFERQINHDAVAQLLRFNYIAGPHSIWSGICKLPPGTTLTLRSIDDRAATPTRYWSLVETALHGIGNPLDLDDVAATDHLEAVLKRAVGGQMMADVPLGALLSGESIRRLSSP